MFKVADVSQVIVCTHDSINASGSTSSVNANDNDGSAGGTEAAAKAAKKAAKQWQYPHGLTPPMKCARKKRFRKTKKKKFMDAPEVEKELKRLLRMDLEADTVSWQIVDGNKNKDAAVGDERSQRHVRYSSSSEEELSDVAEDEEKEEML
uniref:TAFII55_N domain-containing protein n=1 Tax=Caenorhabditis japonica TaxID=281687 RepID=A0A8R1INU0_CAEJA